MGTDLTVGEILASLEARISFHREQEALHARQEAHHRERREAHAAELETLTRHFEAFKATAGVAAELARQPADPSEAAKAEADPDPGRQPRASRLVARIVEEKREGESFGARAITREVNQRFGDRLKRPLDVRVASVILRRLRDARRIHLVQEGKAFHEALYAKGRR
jgi:hypothetical protein